MIKKNNRILILFLSALLLGAYAVSLSLALTAAQEYGGPQSWTQRRLLEGQISRAARIRDELAVEVAGARDSRLSALAQVERGAMLDGGPGATGGGGKDGAAFDRTRAELLAAGAQPQWATQPEAKELFVTLRRESARREVAESHGPFFKNTLLNPKESARLTDLLMQKRLDIRELADAKILTGVETPEAIAGAVDTISPKYEGQIRALLGRQAYAELEEYEQTIGPRNTIRIVRQTLQSHAAAAPLLDSQADALFEALKASQREAQTALQGDYNNIAFMGSPMSTRFMADISTILSPAQLQAVADLQRDMDRQRTLLAALHPENPLQRR